MPNKLLESKKLIQETEHEKAKLFYPENVYCDVFGKLAFPNLPPDAKETLEYLMSTLLKSEADLFILRYRDGMTYAGIGKSYGGLSGERVRHIIAKASRKLRHPSRSKILLLGREAFLKSVVEENEEKKMLYNERIAKLKELAQEQDTEITELQKKLFSLNSRVQPTDDVLSTSIDFLDLSTRAWNGLTRAGIKTVKDILEFDDLFKVPNLGRISIQEIQNKLRIFVSAAGQS